MRFNRQILIVLTLSLGLACTSLAETRDCGFYLGRSRQLTQPVVRTLDAAIYKNGIELESQTQRLSNIFWTLKFKVLTNIPYMNRVPRVDLNQNERKFFLDSTRRNIEITYQRILQMKNSMPIEIDNMKFADDAIELLFSNQRRLEQSSTYLEMLAHARSSADLQSIIERHYLVFLKDNTLDWLSAKNETQRQMSNGSTGVEKLFLKVYKGYGASKGGNFLAPTDLSLSILDFNYLVGSGVGPVGLIGQSELGDGGRLVNPNEYFDHDVAHTIYTMTGKMTVAQRATWLSILASIDQLPERQRMIAHVLAFYVTHEMVLLSATDILNYKIFDESLKSEKQELVKRLKTDNGFGIDLLVTTPPTEKELEAVGKVLVNIIRERGQ